MPVFLEGGEKDISGYGRTWQDMAGRRTKEFWCRKGEDRAGVARFGTKCAGSSLQPVLPRFVADSIFWAGLKVFEGKRKALGLCPRALGLCFLSSLASGAG